MCYNNTVINNSVIDFKEVEIIANKDHSLDNGIVSAAYEEFLSCGFQKASLHKIAEKAGVTTGAIYTRYKNKDALFVSLLQDFFGTLKTMFAPAALEYEKAAQAGTTSAFLQAIDFEERIYIELLTEYYDECILFFGRSDGSSVETMLKDLMNSKTEQTVAFLNEMYDKTPEPDAIRLLMGSQFWYFRQLLNEHLEGEKMFACLHTLIGFFNAGWRQLCSTLQ